jgi:hypothetical protein
MIGANSDCQDVGGKSRDIRRGCPNIAICAVANLTVLVVTPALQGASVQKGTRIVARYADRPDSGENPPTVGRLNTRLLLSAAGYRANARRFAAGLRAG